MTFAYKVEIEVATEVQLTPDQVKEALCRYLHEECVNFTCTDTETVIEFTDVGEVKEIPWIE